MTATAERRRYAEAITATVAMGARNLREEVHWREVTNANLAGVAVAARELNAADETERLMALMVARP